MEERRFKKIVIIDDIDLNEEGRAALRSMADEMIEYRDDSPVPEDEIIRRTGDADALFVSMNTYVGEKVIEQCGNLRYIGMNCSLYSASSANVDIIAAEKHGIKVTGIHDYGDRGVIEFALGEMIRAAHGWDVYKGRHTRPKELCQMKIGIIGMGNLGKRAAKAFIGLEAPVSYYSRTRKEEIEAFGAEYRPLKELLSWADAVLCFLNKNTVIIGREELQAFGNGKILLNCGLNAPFELEPMKEWLAADKKNMFVCDADFSLGYPELDSFENVYCRFDCAGYTELAWHLRNQKVVENAASFLKNS